MEARIIPRPGAGLLSSSPRCVLSPLISSRRHQSSYRRTKQRLNIKPDASFLISNSSPSQDHIIFNPPASTPSVLHTPYKFLPREDKRKQLLSAFTDDDASTRLPPSLPSRRSVPHAHLTENQVREMQKLKGENPALWTNSKLAKKYNCSSAFVSTCVAQVEDTTGVQAARMAEQRAKLEAIKARWGTRRTLAREDRVKRIELALKDQ